MSSVFCCPECGNKHLQAVEKTGMHRKKYSAKQVWLRFLLFGTYEDKIGKGAVGSIDWRCLNCGHKFEDPNCIRKKIDSCQVPVPGIILALSGILTAVLFYMIFLTLDKSIGSLLALIFVAIGTAFGLVVEIWRRFYGKKMEKQLFEIQNGMEKFNK